MRFRIDDNLPTSGTARSLSWRATIDGKWVLLVHDAKRDRLTYEFPDDLASDEHTFRLEVTDRHGECGGIRRILLALEDISKPLA